MPREWTGSVLEDKNELSIASMKKEWIADPWRACYLQDNQKGNLSMDNIQQEILAIIRPAHLASLATVSEDGRPWVRYVIPRASDDLSLRVATRVNSRKVAHIRQNPEVHLTCGVSDPRHVDTFLRIQGKAEFTTDRSERESFWDPHLENVFKGSDDPNYGVIRITPYRIEVWKEGPSEPDVWEAK